MSKCVWVIDDDEIYQIIIKKLISRSEIFQEQSYYTNANEVFEQLEKADIFLPDAILLDINMPQMDGWQFIEKLKTIHPDLAEKTDIFIVSSSIAYSDKERADKFPEVTAFLSKPVSVEEIKNIGNSLNKKTRSRDQV